MARVVLVTGVGRYLGGQVAARLSAEPAIDRIIGVDTVVPDQRAGQLGRTEFVRADIRHPLVSTVLEQAQVDTVVHPRLRDLHYVGTTALLAACERAGSVSRLVAESSTRVYRADRAAPAVHAEDMVTATADGGREARLRSFARRRADVAVSMLRLADLVGPGVDNWLTRYLTLPVAPVAVGYGPRLQVLHEFDAVEVVAHACLQTHPGVTNVAADGVLTLAQALRWSGRLRVPVPSAALRLLPYELAALQFGRVVDTTRLRTRFGYHPRYTSAEAMQDFLARRAAGVPRADAPVLAVLGTAQRWADT